jgi:hypothetical protein
MAKGLTPEQWQELFIRDAGLGSFEMSDRDMAVAILDRMDYEQQLVAISGLLRRNKAADEQLEIERKEIITFIRKSDGPTQHRATDESQENFYAMVYQGAAHSMAALGMIAPLYESMFYQAFQGIRTNFFGVNAILPGHRSSITDPDAFWNCRNYYDRGSAKVKVNVPAGIQQLAKAVDLKRYLPPDLFRVLDALFDYRNHMFHDGFEWPQERCAQFAKRVDEKGWQQWFTNSIRGDDPWIFYMTDEFIKHCLDMVAILLEAFGKYCKERDRIQTIPIESIPSR